MNIQDWLPLGLVGLISLLSNGLSRVFSSTTMKVSILRHSSFFTVQLSHLYMTAGKNIVWLNRHLSVKCCLWFLICYLGFHSFPSKEQVSVNFMATVIAHSDLATQENKICHNINFFPFYLPWSHGTRCHDLGFCDVEFAASFFTPLFHRPQEAF